jgi:hypothetical protein
MEDYLKVAVAVEHLFIAELIGPVEEFVAAWRLDE